MTTIQCSFIQSCVGKGTELHSQYIKLMSVETELNSSLFNGTTSAGTQTILQYIEVKCTNSFISL